MALFSTFRSEVKYSNVELFQHFLRTCCFVLDYSCTDRVQYSSRFSLFETFDFHFIKIPHDAQKTNSISGLQMTSNQEALLSLTQWFPWFVCVCVCVWLKLWDTYLENRCAVTHQISLYWKNTFKATSADTEVSTDPCWHLTDLLSESVWGSSSDMI